ncbi:MAG: ABC transporter ATP-binding protein [Erysipelotrichaceae bacterium]|nr:ABC transporter ATP-binding protein [Erysipelotrichaceae bacterium]
MIQLQHIHLKINDQLLLENETLEIYEGYVHVIMGESGCGKTTLLYEISLLSHISEYSYIWNDIYIDKLNHEQRAEIRRNHIGYLLQDLELISENLTLEDNIKCMYALSGQSYNESKVNEYMQKMHLNIPLSQKVVEMSRGERQCFALVLALIKDVELIILDEPTSALDKDNTIALMDYLHMIAYDYHKMIVIASHDRYVGDQADILYKIEDKHLINQYNTDIEKHDIVLKEPRKVIQQFYQIYNKAHHQLMSYILKIIYIVLIFILCIVPIALNALIEKQEELYDIYADKEIIVANTSKQGTTYNGYNPLLNEDQINLLKQLDHIEDIHYYYQMSGSIINNNNYIEITVIPKDIDKPAVSKALTSSTLYLGLTYEGNDYYFEYELDDYDIVDYPIPDGINNEVIYIPYEAMETLVKTQNIETSSSVSIICDNTDNIEDVMTSISYWLSDVSVSANGLKYLEQLDMLEKLQSMLILLRIVLIIGTIILTFITQTMENKTRENEICTLRMNGMNQKMYTYLYFFENRYTLFLTFILCMIGYIIVSIIFDTNIPILLFILEVLIYISVTKIIPLILSLKQIFSKEISEFLRNINSF